MEDSAADLEEESVDLAEDSVEEVDWAVDWVACENTCTTVLRTASNLAKASNPSRIHFLRN